MATKRKYTKKSQYWNKTNTTPVESKSKETTSEKIEKVGNTNMATSRLQLTEIGTSALSTIKAFTRFTKPMELRYPENLRTYNEMEDDVDVSEALEANYTFVDRAFVDFTIDYNKESEKSKEAAQFVDWCLRNMDGQTLRQAMRSAATHQKYGFAILEKVYTKIKDGSEYDGHIKVKKLAFRPPETLDTSRPFIISEDGRDVLGVVQNINNVLSYGYNRFTSTILGKREIPRNKFILFNVGATDSNPMGKSPLDSIYNPWKEKTLLSEYEVIGVSKDMGGMPVLHVPADILNRAAADPNSDEAYSLEILKANLANLHAGEQAYMILPSDTQGDGSSIKQYDLSFKGVEGSGKQLDIAELIQRKKKEIFDRFGAGFLIVGNDNSGSYSLSDNKQTVHSHYVERVVDNLAEGINTDLIPQLLALNNIRLTDKDMPKFKPDDTGDPDIEANSKMLQRIIAVGGLPITAEVQQEIYEKLGFEFKLDEELFSDPEKFLEWKNKYGSENKSRSGDGLAAGGLNGTSSNASSDNSSDLNSENAS